VEQPDGAISERFGTASNFLVVEKALADGSVLSEGVALNPFADVAKGRGIKVAHWLIDRKVDVLITRDDIRDKGPGHALGDGGIEVFVTETVEPVVAIGQVWNSLL